MAKRTRSMLKRDDDFWVMKPAYCQTSDNNLTGVSVWCDRDNIFRFTYNVCDGDRLELKDSDNLHSWAIFKSISEWNPSPWSAVLIFNPASEKWGAYSKTLSVPASKNVIVVTTIFWLLSEPGSEVRINNFMDYADPPLGMRYISKEVTYQLKELHESAVDVKVYVCRNQFEDSEDFVNYCRYDRDRQHKYRRGNNYRRVSKWYHRADIEYFIPQVRVGDRLQFRCRFGFSPPHGRWGIYIGQRGDDLEQVVLFAHDDKTNSATSTERLKVKPKLRVTSIGSHVFAGRYQVRINNEDDRMWLPLDRENILKEISRQLSGRAGKHYECNVLFKDIKGFVNYCRYDDWRINFGLVSDWCGFLEILPQLRIGDRLEFNRTARPYMHWGIFVGDWELWHYQAVVHFAPADGNGKIFSRKKSSGSGSSAKDKPVLCIDSIQDVSSNDKVRINNKGDLIWPPFDRMYIDDEIMRQMESQQAGHKPVYNLFSNNCEHFVNHCRYGEHHSDQVSRITRIRDRLQKGH